MMDIRIGTAGWSIPVQSKNQFAAEGSHLERYSRRFNCVEINSSFYRDHLASTYKKWAACTPEDFQFSVKLSQYFTHDCRLREVGERLRSVLENIQMLGEKWKVLLIQLPPSLNFEQIIVERFLENLRQWHSGPVVFEPRHLTWHSPDAHRILGDFAIDRVEADPECCPIEIPPPPDPLSSSTRIARNISQFL